MLTATERKSLHQGNACRWHSHVYLTAEKARTTRGSRQLCHLRRPAPSTGALGKSTDSLQPELPGPAGAGLRMGLGTPGPRTQRPRPRPRCAPSVTAGQGWLDGRRQRRGARLAIGPGAEWRKAAGHPPAPALLPGSLGRTPRRPRPRRTARRGRTAQHGRRRRTPLRERTRGRWRGRGPRARPHPQPLPAPPPPAPRGRCP